MNPDIERFRALGRLIRAAKAELKVRQVDLVNAHESQLNPVMLGLQIANLGRQISGWQKERETLFRRIAGSDGTESVSSSVRSLILDRLSERSRSPGT
jgi:hypothetical protein